MCDFFRYDLPVFETEFDFPKRPQFALAFFAAKRPTPDEEMVSGSEPYCKMRIGRDLFPVRIHISLKNFMKVP